jgi:hypothetical protein
MNIFRLAGDMMHLLSIVVLLLKITATKSCRGAQQAAAVPPFLTNSTQSSSSRQSGAQHV